MEKNQRHGFFYWLQHLFAQPLLDAQKKEFDEKKAALESKIKESMEREKIMKSLRDSLQKDLSIARGIIEAQTERNECELKLMKDQFVEYQASIQLQVDQAYETIFARGEMKGRVSVMDDLDKSIRMRNGTELEEQDIENVRNGSIH